VEIPVHRTVRDKIKELKKRQSYSEYLFSLTKYSEGQDSQSQPTDESREDSNNEYGC